MGSPLRLLLQVIALPPGAAALLECRSIVDGALPGQLVPQAGRLRRLGLVGLRQLRQLPLICPVILASPQGPPSHSLPNFSSRSIFIVPLRRLLIIALHAHWGQLLLVLPCVPGLSSGRPPPSLEPSITHEVDHQTYLPSLPTPPYLPTYLLTTVIG